MKERSIPLRWSVVIPAYNEENRLAAHLREIIAYFDRRGESYEVIVVDDGSRDATAEQAFEYNRKSHLIMIEYLSSAKDQ